MPNALLTATGITREALRVLHQKLTFVGSITRGYDKSFAKEGAKIGDTLKIRMPNEYKIRRGRTLVPQDTVEENIELKVQEQTGVDLSFTSADLTLSMDDFSERVLEPAMSILAATIESDAMSMYKDVANQINNHGNPADLKKFLLARQALVDNLAPDGGRTVALNTTDNVDMVDALKGLFNSKESIAAQNRDGVMGRTSGFDFTETTHLNTHLRGAADAAYTTSTQVAAMPITEPNVPKSAITVASGAGAAKKGDVFTIAGVFRVHPETKANTGKLMQFVVDADYVGGAGSLTFAPAIRTSGARQNVVIPATSATASIVFAGAASGASGVSLAYHKSAFAIAFADLIMPKGVDFASRQSMDGISMRIVRAYDINNDAFPCRIDTMYGWKTLRRQMAVRLANN